MSKPCDLSQSRSLVLSAFLMRLAALALGITVALEAGTTSAEACRYQRGLFLQVMDSWKATCRHPLCGAIYATDPQRLVGLKSCDQDSYLAFRHDTRETLTKNGFVLFGEIHDNPEHHRLRAAWIGELMSERQDGQRKGRPAAVFEHIRLDQKAGLDLFTEMSRSGQHIATAPNLFRFLKWAESGWPTQAIFEPLFAAVITHRLPMLPGDPARATVRAVAKGSLTALGDTERTRLGLDRVLEPALQDALLGELETSHCGLVPKSAFSGMADAQRYRDAHQAAVLVQAIKLNTSGKSGAILFAGNGHVRSDRAVPFYLRQTLPRRKIVTAVPLEIEDGKTDPVAYVPRGPDGKPAANYVIFTPRHQRKDPCVEMREQFQKKPEKQ